MKILITGVTGMLGQCLVDKLILSKPEIEMGLVVRSMDKIKNTWLNHKHIKIIHFSENDSFNKDVISFSPVVAIHLAAYLTSSSEIEAIHNLIDSNIKFGTLILNALKKTQLKLFVNTGTFAEYYNNDGKYNPTYLYAATKQAFISIISYYQTIQHFKAVHIIPYTIYGAKEQKKKVIDILLESINSKIPLKFSDGHQKLDFIHIDDVIDFYLEVIDNVFNPFILDGDKFFLGTGKSHSIREVANIIEKITGKMPNIAWGMVEKRERDTTLAIASSFFLEEKFNWKYKIDIESGIKKMIESQ